ncbi:MAG: lytic transglycosylase domain-containing protein [Bacteroidota bacterium]
MNKKIIGASLVLLLIGGIIGYASSKKIATKKTISEFSVPTEYETEDSIAMMQHVVPVRLPAGLNFAGEVMPTNDWDVRERMEREMLINIYYHSNTIQNIKLANRYFPDIEKILKEQGVPDDFKYLALAESGLKNVTSPAHAEGFWQFMSETGVKYGLEINESIDMRYDITASTIAACKYLKDAKAKFGNWTMAAASYNMGQDGLQNQANFQKSNNYYDLYLNTETSRYLFRILALKEVYEHQEKYGYHFESEDLYQPIPYAVVQVDSSITDLVGFAQMFGTNYKSLKLMNPWIQSRTLPNKYRKTYEIKIPNYKK